MSGIGFIVLTKKILDQFGHLKIGKSHVYQICSLSMPHIKYPPAGVSASLFVYLSVRLPAYLPTYLPACLPVCSDTPAIPIDISITPTDYSRHRSLIRTCMCLTIPSPPSSPLLSYHFLSSQITHVCFILPI